MFRLSFRWGGAAPTGRRPYARSCLAAANVRKKGDADFQVGGFTGLRQFPRCGHVGAVTRRILASAALTALLACGKNATGPSITVDFPPLDTLLTSALCIRGDRTVGQNATGTIATSDCNAATVDSIGGGYFEIWRVRVDSARTVTFRISSQFDSFLTVVRLDSWDNPTRTYTYTLLGRDDDSAGNLDALLTVSLQPAQDYFVAVAGFDQAEHGNYTLTIR
jgi:hypothetical protein